MIASERRRVTASPGPGAVAVVGNGLQRGSSGVNQILSSGRAVKIYVIDPRKFQERLEKYVGGLGGVRKSSTEDSKSKSEEKKSIIVDLTGGDDDVIIEEERLVSKKDVGRGGHKLSVIAPAPPNPPNKESHEVNRKEDQNGKQDEPPGTSGTVSEPKKPKKKPTKKRKPPATSTVRRGSKAEDVEAEIAFLRKETTTRTGRVSKSPAAAAAASTAVNGTLGSLNNIQGSQPSSPSGSLFISSGPNSRVPSPSPSLGSISHVSQGQPGDLPLKKKRVPPEMFRCVTCNKFYVGFAKFNGHFAKFPDHVKSDAKKGTKRKKMEDGTAVAVVVNDVQSTQSTTSTSDNVSSFPSTSLGTIQSSSTNPGNNQTSFHVVTPPPSSITSPADSPIITAPFSSINPHDLSDNCSSPKVSEGYNFNSTSSNQQTSFLNSSSSSSLPLLHSDNNLLPPLDLPHMSLPLNNASLTPLNEDNNAGGRTEDFFMDFTPHISEISQIPSELLGQGSCSPQSFNSLENLLADSNSQPARLSPRLPLEVPEEENARGPPTNLLSSNDSSRPDTSNRSTFFSLNEEPPAGGSLVQNSSNNVSSYVASRQPNRSSIVVPVDEESRDLCIHNGSDLILSSLDGELSSAAQQTNEQSTQQRRKSIWEFVKEQIRLCGINQACGEISEMAEKLSKVARDKFYPIREEEIEGMNGTPPIIQVETPFISHLLDLPFGTYIFKEDGGIRKVIPPPTPISSELSLTNGVEVDVHKFLSADIDDLISLPHLTNLDFTSICKD